MKFFFSKTHQMTVPLLELSIEKLREEELEEARAIQSVMPPEHALRASGVRISHEFQPIAGVGGDFLDYFQLSDGTIGLYLGDVSGKGLAAAMYAALAGRHVARRTQDCTVTLQSKPVKRTRVGSKLNSKSMRLG